MRFAFFKSIHLGSQRTLTFLFWIAFSIFVHFALTCTLFHGHKDVPCEISLEQGVHKITLEAAFVKKVKEAARISDSQPLPILASEADSEHQISSELSTGIISHKNDVRIAPVDDSPIENSVSKNEGAIAELLVPEGDSAYQASQQLESHHMPASLIKNPHPRYPAQARALGQSGIVRLEVVIDVNGKPKSADLLQSSGFALLDERAQETVLKKWRFQPAKVNYQPIESAITVTIDFVLNTEN